jgi:hypothetical protein
MESDYSFWNRPGFLPMAPRMIADDIAEKVTDLRERLVGHFMCEHGSVLDYNQVRRAVLEADSLALLTPHPELVLPVLAEEKVLAARRWWERQRELLDRTSISLTE